MSLPRSNPERPHEGYPTYGAVHGVIPNQQVRNFLYQFARVSDFVFTQSVAGEPVEPITWVNEEDEKKDFKFPALSEAAVAVSENYDPRKFYRMFDLETLGVSVLEMDPSAQQARRFKALWESHDIGAAEQEIKNEVARSQPTTRPRLIFDRLVPAGRRLPGVPNTDTRQKLALAPQPGKHTETLDTIDNELDAVASVLRRRLKQFVVPTDVVPHVSFMVFRRHADVDSIATIAESMDTYLRKWPVGAALEGISFRSKLDRPRHRR